MFQQVIGSWTILEIRRDHIWVCPTTSFPPLHTRPQTALRGFNVEPERPSGGPSPLKCPTCQKLHAGFSFARFYCDGAKVETAGPLPRRGCCCSHGACCPADPPPNSRRSPPSPWRCPRSPAGCPSPRLPQAEGGKWGRRQGWQREVIWVYDCDLDRATVCSVLSGRRPAGGKKT